MFQYRKITMDSITQAQFRQIVEIAAEADEDPFTEEMLEDCIENLYTVACLDGDTVLGYVVVNPNSKKYFGGCLYIVDIIVRHENRRQGIGEKLLKTVLSAFHQSSKLALDVEINNAGAIALYQKLGFRKTDILTENLGEYMVMAKE